MRFTQWLRPAFAAVVLALLSVAAASLADWLQPDASIRDAQLTLRMAVRDTTDHPGDVARLDSVGVALLKLARLEEAGRVFDRVAELDPQDATSRAARGKLALFADEPAVAESLLGGLEASDDQAAADLFAARLRRGEYAAAAEMTPIVHQEGRRELLTRLSQRAPYEITAGPERAVVPFERGYPVVLVKVKLNGQLVVMAVDTGSSDLLIDDMAFRRYRVQPVAGQSVVFWSGSRNVVKNAIVQRLELGGYRLENCPAGVIGLGRWSLEANPQSERVAGVIGLNLLRRFSPTIDYKDFKLELRRPGVAWTPKEGASRVPFLLWGESELTVFGTISQGRRLAMVVQTGVPGCGIGAPQDVFDEFGIKPGAMAKLAKGAGRVLQGRSWTSVVVPAVTVGPIARDKVAGWSGALDSGELWRHGVRRDVLLSHDFFRDRRMTIDWERHELVFEGE
jgi:hypothetical protein